MDEINDVEFKKRVRVSINKVAYERNLTNKTLSPLLNVAPTTISNYRTMKNLAKASFVIKFCDLFECNKEWLLTGKGRPFLDSGDDYPGLIDKYWEIPAISARKMREVVGKTRSFTGPIPYHTLAVQEPMKEDILLYNKEEAENFNIDKAAWTAHRIMSSGTPYAAALYLNITQFAAALDMGSELKMCRDEIRDLTAQVNELRSEVDRLKAVPTTATPPDASSEEQAM